MKSSFCIDLQRFMLIPTKFPLSRSLLFDGKSMMNIKRSEDSKKYHNDILNRIKSAKKQADNVVLEIPTFVSRKTISGTIKGFLMQSSKERVIIVKHGKKCYIYNRKYLE